jgi:hypothetical protein
MVIGGRARGQRDNACDGEGNDDFVRLFEIHKFFANIQGGNLYFITTTTFFSELGSN